MTFLSLRHFNETRELQCMVLADKCHILFGIIVSGQPYWLVGAYLAWFH
jgi:hypothetical protein